MIHSIQYRSDNGMYICTSRNGPYMLSGTVDTKVKSKANTVKPPGFDGASTYDPTLEQMEIVFRIAVNIGGNRNIPARTARDEMKNILSFCFSPNQFGSLIYNNSVGEHYARVRPTCKPEIVEQNESYVVYEIEMESDYPYWQGEKKTEFVGHLTKMLRYPVKLQSRYGIYQQGCVVYNPSPIKIYPVFELQSAVTQFKITNETNGEMFEINHAVASGETMRIDTYRNTVNLISQSGVITDVSNYVDGDFVTLASGKNRIISQNEISGDTPACKIVWRVPRAEA